jgi:hypothetical protein
LLEEGVLPVEVKRDLGKIRLLARKITLHRGDCRDHRPRGHGGVGAGHPAQQDSFRRLSAVCRQLEACDADVAPSDATEAAGGFEDDIVLRGLAHHPALVVRSGMKIVQPRPEFNPVFAANVTMLRVWSACAGFCQSEPGATRKRRKRAMCR